MKGMGRWSWKGKGHGEKVSTRFFSRAAWKVSGNLGKKERLEGSREVGGGELIMFVGKRENEREGEALLRWRLEVRWAG